MNKIISLIVALSIIFGIIGFIYTSIKKANMEINMPEKEFCAKLSNTATAYLPVRCLKYYK